MSEFITFTNKPKKAWKCQRCGKITKTTRKKPPAICENPNCESKGQFENITHETTTIDGKNILAEEIINENGEPRFAYLNNDKIHYTSHIQTTSEKDPTKQYYFIPKIDNAIKSGAIILPTRATPYDNIKELIQKIRDFIHTYLDVTPQYEKIASYYILMTWVYDELNVLSYLRFLGDTGTGKSRGLNTIGRLCYKPMMISGAVRPAPIYRLIEQWKGTLIIDEADLKNSDMYSEVVTILNCGYERGRPVIRCTKDNPDDLQFHNTFGPKIISTRREFHDKALESRCLTEQMKQTERDDIPDQLPDKAYRQMRKLRNKLLYFRLKNKKSVDIARSQEANLLSFEPRLRQVTRCFLAVFDDPSVKQELLDFLVKHQREIIEQRAATWEGMVINAIKELREQWHKERPGEALISAKDISQYIQETYGEQKLTPGKVGSRLRSFDIETERHRYTPLNEDEERQRRCIVWDEEKLNTLYKRYVPGVTPVTDVTGVKGTTTLERIDNLSMWARSEVESSDPSYAVTSVTSVTSVSERLIALLKDGPFPKKRLLKVFDDKDLVHAKNLLVLWQKDGKVMLNKDGEWELMPK